MNLSNTCLDTLCGESAPLKVCVITPATEDNIENFGQTFMAVAGFEHSHPERTEWTREREVAEHYKYNIPL
jgi:hypothetical protein